jgi:hypothetical protein
MDAYGDMLVAVKLSVYLPDDLAERLRVVKDELNVSEVCQAALIDAVDAAETARLGDRRQLIVQRLRRTRTPEQQLGDHGVAAGRRWAADAASLVDLKAVADSPNSDHTLGGALERVRLWHQTAAASSLGRPAGLMEVVLTGIAAAGISSQTTRPDYLNGFKRGAREVWESVRSEIER